MPFHQHYNKAITNLLCQLLNCEIWNSHYISYEYCRLLGSDAMESGTNTLSFWEICCFHLQGERWGKQVSLKYLKISTTLHDMLRTICLITLVVYNRWWNFLSHCGSSYLPLHKDDYMSFVMDCVLYSLLLPRQIRTVMLVWAGYLTGYKDIEECLFFLIMQEEIC